MISNILLHLFKGCVRDLFRNLRQHFFLKNKPVSNLCSRPLSKIYPNFVNAYYVCKLHSHVMDHSWTISTLKAALGGIHKRRHQSEGLPKIDVYNFCVIMSPFEEIYLLFLWGVSKIVVYLVNLTQVEGDKKFRKIDDVFYECRAGSAKIRIGLLLQLSSSLEQAQNYFTFLL